MNLNSTATPNFTSFRVKVCCCHIHRELHFDTFGSIRFARRAFVYHLPPCHSPDFVARLYQIVQLPHILDALCLHFKASAARVVIDLLSQNLHVELLQWYRMKPVATVSYRTVAVPWLSVETGHLYERGHILTTVHSRSGPQ